MSSGNLLNQDFRIYSNFSDLASDINRWQYCNYDDYGVGIFRDCGKTSLIGGNWLGNNNYNITLGYVPTSRPASVFLK